jgi:hypothetical protein
MRYDRDLVFTLTIGCIRWLDSIEPLTPALTPITGVGLLRLDGWRTLFAVTVGLALAALFITIGLAPLAAIACVMAPLAVLSLMLPCLPQAGSPSRQPTPRD